MLLNPLFDRFAQGSLLSACHPGCFDHSLSCDVFRLSNIRAVDTCGTSLRWIRLTRGLSLVLVSMFQSLIGVTLKFV